MNKFNLLFLVMTGLIALHSLPRAFAFNENELRQANDAISESHNQYFKALMEKGRPISREEAAKIRRQIVTPAEKKYTRILNRDLSEAQRAQEDRRQKRLAEIKKNPKAFVKGATEQGSGGSSTPAFQPPTREEIRLDGKGIKRNLEFGAKPAPTQAAPATPSGSGEVGIHGR